MSDQPTIFSATPAGPAAVLKTGLVLGIDPGLPQTGYAVTREGVIFPDLCGVWRHGTTEGDEEERQRRYGVDLIGLLAALAQRGLTVSLLATEAQFQRRSRPEANARSLIIVAAMRGFFVGYCAARDIRTVKVPANVAFRALTGNNNADEDQRLAAAGRLLGRKLLKGEIHLADAAGFALAVERREGIAGKIGAARTIFAQRTAGQVHTDRQSAARPGVKQRVIG